MRLPSAPVLFPFLLAAGCATAPPLGDVQQDCEAMHPHVGWQAELSTRAHDVAGTATLLDDCTVELSGFTFDGDGLDVRLVLAGADEDYANGVIISDDLRGAPYEDDTLEFALPMGASLNDAIGISVWCWPAGVSFGDGLFAEP